MSDMPDHRRVIHLQAELKRVEEALGCPEQWANEQIIAERDDLMIERDKYKGICKDNVRKFDADMEIAQGAMAELTAERDDLRAELKTKERDLGMAANTIAELESEVARLREGLKNLANWTLDDDTFCFCPHRSRGGAHEWYCKDARQLLADPVEGGE